MDTASTMQPISSVLDSIKRGFLQLQGFGVNQFHDKMVYFLNDGMNIKAATWNSLKGWILARSGKAVNPQPKLVYRATVDGFAASQFHAKCDNKPRLLVVCRNNSGYVFGGFSVVAFRSSGNYVADAQSFLFSLINHANAAPAMFPFQSGNGPYDHVGSGPTYGSVNYSCHYLLRVII